MPDIIHLLPDSLANQIAAGEVVQRPASVVKELLENSVDAHSTHIQLIIKDAGKILIQIVDNGSGMSETDARMSLERHATSKIRKTEDLFSIRTLGFRGEALASIAAVAQVEIKTKRAEDETGTCIRIEGSTIISQEPVACEKGTSISVKNLFYNVPARRNFLKSNPVEMRHILDEFHRIALAYPHIAMSLYQNDMEVFNVPSEKLAHRIVSLFGKTYKEQLIACKEETEMLKVEGYIGKPEHSKKTRGEQFFFANNRFIKHGYLHHAVMNAFDELLHEESFPFYVIFIEIDPKHIDINVHPTKTEIKFDDEKTVYHIIRAAVKKALGTHNITPSLDFDLNVNFNAFGGGNMGQVHQQYEQPARNNWKSPEDKNNLDNWETLYSNFKKGTEVQQNTGLTSSFIPSQTEEEITLEKNQLYSENNSTFQLHQRYIVSQVKSGMVIVDQHAAHERILYEKYLNMLQNKFGASQQFLFPQSIELSSTDLSLVMELEEEIRALGFVFSMFSKNTIVVNGIPADVPGGSEKGLFEGLIEQFKQNKTELKLERRENLARSIAKKSALKPGTKLSLTEMNTLIDQLFACKVPNYAPNGNLTIVLMDMAKIGKLFNKN
ncbi:MAG TPA: DNA mismatch repair endonuclease MutL [Cytophagaceae bacterium]|jgi:DNA mismatch repair protein MutL